MRTIRALLPAALGLAAITSMPAFAETSTPAISGQASGLALVEAAASLTPGQYLWEQDAAAGPVSILISIPDQKAYVYRGDNLVAIDWEYAAMGSRYFDVAIACEALPNGERDAMIQQVFGDTLDADLMTAGNQIATLVTALWQSCFAIADAKRPADWVEQTLSP